MLISGNLTYPRFSDSLLFFKKMMSDFWIYASLFSQTTEHQNHGNLFQVLDFKGAFQL